jgi:O-antigen ligase
MIWMIVPAQYKARYETVDKLKDDESYQNRVLSWEGGFQMFLSNPVTGVGPDNYTTANGEKYWPGKGVKHWLNAHSLYFKLLGDLGLIGVVTFFGYLFKVFRLNSAMTKVLKEQGASSLVQRFPFYCQVSICLLLFTGYSAHNLYRNTWFILGAVSAAIAMLQFDSSTVKTEVKRRAPVGAWVPGAVQEASDALVISHI